ncbi:hypothetical protein, partial [Staphylococcus epidermidis]
IKYFTYHSLILPNNKHPFILIYFCLLLLCLYSIRTT